MNPFDKVFRDQTFDLFDYENDRFLTWSNESTEADEAVATNQWFIDKNPVDLEYTFDNAEEEETHEQDMPHLQSSSSFISTPWMLEEEQDMNDHYRPFSHTNWSLQPEDNVFEMYDTTDDDSQMINSLQWHDMPETIVMPSMQDDLFSQEIDEFIEFHEE